MAKAAIVIIVLAAGGLLFGYWYRQDRAMRAQQDQQISELNAQVSKLRSENDRLKAELTKVEDEEAKLAANNELLRKAIEQAKVTGKMPSKLPYPPK